MVIPRPSLKRGRDRSRREDVEKKRGRLRHGCRNQNCASAPAVARPTQESQSCMLSGFPSEVSRRFEKVTVHIGERDRWPQATAHIIDQIILRNFV